MITGNDQKFHEVAIYAGSFPFLAEASSKLTVPKDMRATLDELSKADDQLYDQVGKAMLEINEKDYFHNWKDAEKLVADAVQLTRNTLADLLKSPWLDQQKYQDWLKQNPVTADIEAGHKIIVRTYLNLNGLYYKLVRVVFIHVKTPDLDQELVKMDNQLAKQGLKPDDLKTMPKFTDND